MGHWDEPTLIRRALPFGLAAGVLGGLYGMAGPVTVVYLIHAGSDPARFRARLTFLSVFWSSFRVATLLLTGSLSADRIVRFALTLPFVLGGLAVGYRLHPRVSPDAFRVGLGGRRGARGRGPRAGHAPGVERARSPRGHAPAAVADGVHDQLREAAGPGGRRGCS